MKGRPLTSRTAVPLFSCPRFVWLFMAGVLLSGCGITIPKYTTIQSEQPPNYYLGESPEVYVVEASGGTRTLQDVAVEELRNQSRSSGYFTIESRLDEGVRFDMRDGRMVMTGASMPVKESTVFVKVNVIASMKQDGRTVITRKKGLFGTEEEQVPAVVTVMPVAFTVTRGQDVLLSERQYDGRAVWTLEEGSGGYPNDRYRRFEIAIGQAVKQFLDDVTPRYVSRKVRLDYKSASEEQKPILDAARNGQVKSAAVQLEEYVAQHPNSASAAYNLAVLTDALGNYEQALTHYDRALSLGGKDYYTEAKSQCMRRMREQRELKEESRRAKRTAVKRSRAKSSLAAEPAAAKQEAVSESDPSGGDSEVARVQRSLNQLGYDCGVVDGLMGPSTRACLEAFQKANGLWETGKLDEATLDKIREVQ